MPITNLNLLDCFPAGTDGSHKPLPKQEEFLEKAIAPGGAKYIAYVGGI